MASAETAIFQIGDIAADAALLSGSGLSHLHFGMCGWRCAWSPHSTSPGAAEAAALPLPSLLRAASALRTFSCM